MIVMKPHAIITRFSIPGFTVIAMTGPAENPLKTIRDKISERQIAEAL
jgi:hypothetical protein